MLQNIITLRHFDQLTLYITVLSLLSIQISPISLAVIVSLNDFISHYLFHIPLIHNPQYIILPFYKHH